MEKENKKKKRLIFIICIIIILLLLLLLGYFLLNTRNHSKPLFKISDNQLKAENPNLNKTSKDEYFELVGFGQLEINKDNPNINLINPSNNGVYLSFDVIYNDKSLFKTELIEPGNMEQFDIYSCLNAGEHTITYSINVYDITNHNPLWTGIQQQQDIVVIK